MKYKLSIYVLSLYQMSMLVISVIMADITSVFPDVPIPTIQLLATFPDLMIMLFSLLTGFLLRKIQCKYLMIFSAFLFIVAGIGGIFIHRSLSMLFIWSFFIGSAIGILIPSVISSINHNTTGADNIKTLGYQNTSISIGAMIFSLLSGYLAANLVFNYSYAIYVLAIIPLVMIAMFVKNDNNSNSEKKSSLSLRTALTYGIYVMVFFSIYNIIPVNITLLIEQKHLDYSFGSIGTCILLLGSVISGTFFAKVYSIFQKRTLYIGLASLLLGLLLQISFDQIPLIALGLIVSGLSLSLVMAASTKLLSSKEEDADMAISIMMAMSDGGGFVTSFYSYTILLAFGSFSLNLLYGLGCVLCVLLLIWTRYIKS